MLTKQKTLLALFLVSLQLISYTKAADDDKLDEKCGTANPLEKCDLPYIVCKGTECKHKDVFAMELKEFFGIIVIFIVAMFAVASGIGGGGLFVPILILLFDLSPKEAIALSNGLIFFNSATKFLLSIYEKHPKYPYKPQIDYNIAIVFNPMILFGAYVGVIINTMLPDLVILIVLVITIIVAAQVSYVKGRQVWKQENIDIALMQEKKKDTQTKEAAKTDEERAAEKKKAESVMYKKLGDKYTVIEEDDAKRMLGMEINRRVMEMSEDPVEDENINVNLMGSTKPVNIKKIDQAQVNTKNDNQKRIDESNLNTPNKNSILENTDREPINNTPGKIQTKNEEAKPIAKAKADEPKKSMVMLKVGTPEEDPNQDGLQHERWLIRKEEAIVVPKLKFAIVWLVFFGTIIAMLLQGSKGADSIVGLKKCGTGDWIIFFVYCIFTFSIALWGSSISRKEEDRKEKANWAYVNLKDEPRWTGARVLAANICAPIVGLCAAAVGLGGGVSLNPTLLSFGFAPIVVSATSMFLIMVSKLAAALLYVLAGKMPVGYWIFGGAFLVAATCIAQYQQKQVIKKQGRQSIIAFVFVFFMYISVVLIVAVGAMKTKQNLDDDKDIWKFSSYCDADKK